MTFTAMDALSRRGARVHCIVNGWENFRITPMADEIGATWSVGPYWYTITRRRLTPLIAFRRGGVPEGIDHGRTGFLCDTADEMAAHVQRLPEIDRAMVRREAERRFSDTAVVAEYERLYERLAQRIPLAAESPA